MINEGSDTLFSMYVNNYWCHKDPNQLKDCMQSAVL